MKVFVYGSLKEGHSNYETLDWSDAVKIRDTATESDEYTMYNTGFYPGVALGGNTRIQGELYHVTTLEYLDHLEGYPNLFNRIEVKLACGEEAWMYILSNKYHGEDLEVVDSGEWSLRDLN